MNIRAICWATSIAAAARSSASKPRAAQTVLNAQVPLAEMFGYATAIRSLSKGRASYSMEPFTFEQVPEQRVDDNFGLAAKRRPAART